MAHGSEEEGDYWPGYVDALTSMVQVLAFVMMLLAMAVFVLSQNVSKGAVEAIAKAVKMDVPPDANVTELTAKVVEEIQKQQAAAAAATSSKSSTTEDRPPAATPKESSTTPSETVAASTAPTERRTSTRTTMPEKPPEPAADAKHLALQFAARTFKIDAPNSGAITGFVDEHKVAEKHIRLLVRAYASSHDGALSEARRLAYYRAMTVRKELTDRKIRAEDIRINVYDTADKDQGSTVEIFTDGNGDN
jgi:hypothetical protein